MEKKTKELENKEELRKVFGYAYGTPTKEGYVPLSDEELNDIFLENFGGQI